MRAKIDGNYVQVTLSRRNLLALLSHLEQPDRHGPALLREAGDGEPGLLVQAESDDVHYADRPAGPMRARTEDDIARGSSVHLEDQPTEPMDKINPND